MAESSAEEKLKDTHITEKQSDFINILLLGGTGVGKSTFINSFANYLTYADFEVAKQEKLIILIPTQFRVIDHKGKSRRITVGDKDKNEYLKTGEAQTQDVKTYVFPIRDDKNVQMRLIDTPGMGDPRGIDQDDVNCENILSYIANLKELHAICFLLKPNESRDTVFFKYCITQIFSRLDKSACDNIIFCFTNTRGTDYNPGETLDVLKKNVKEIEMKPPHAKIPLKRNVFCFDNECFRYLAALKDDIEFLDEIEDRNVDSWNKSVKECGKLYHYITGDEDHYPLEPHNVKSTNAINEARRIINRLAKPLADISQLIHDNIYLLEKHKANLAIEETSLEELKSQLYIPVNTLEIIQLDQPATVCTARKCAELSQAAVGALEEAEILANRPLRRRLPQTQNPLDSLSDINFIGGTNAWHYKQRCHDPCNLKQVSTEIIGDPELTRCAAMGRGGICKRCGCDFKVHMHVYYLTKHIETREADPNTLKNITNKQELLENKRKFMEDMETIQKELEGEHRVIVETSAKFAHFLHNNAITPFSDAYKEYIEYLITREKSLGAECNSNTVNNLEKLLSVYVQIKTQFDEALKTAREIGDADIISSQDINTCFQKLTELKHNGMKIKELYEAQEKPIIKEYSTKEYIHNGVKNFFSKFNFFGNKNQKRNHRERSAHANYDLYGNIPPHPILMNPYLSPFLQMPPYYPPSQRPTAYGYGKEKLKKESYAATASTSYYNQNQQYFPHFGYPPTLFNNPYYLPPLPSAGYSPNVQPPMPISCRQAESLQRRSQLKDSAEDNIKPKGKTALKPSELHPINQSHDYPLSNFHHYGPYHYHGHGYFPPPDYYPGPSGNSYHTASESRSTFPNRHTGISYAESHSTTPDRHLDAYYSEQNSTAPNRQRHAYQDPYKTDHTIEPLLADANTHPAASYYEPSQKEQDNSDDNKNGEIENEEKSVGKKGKRGKNKKGKKANCGSNTNKERKRNGKKRDHSK